jgi:hypothetical protein
VYGTGTGGSRAAATKEGQHNDNGARDADASRAGRYVFYYYFFLTLLTIFLQINRLHVRNVNGNSGQGEKAETTEMGSNDARRVVRALGECFSFSPCFFDTH